MDALPLTVSRDQLQQMYDSVEQAATDLSEQQFTNGNSEKNLLTYGTSDYGEAHHRVQAIAADLKSQLETWNSDSDSPEVINLSLDTYQLKLLRSYLESTNGAGSAQQSLKSVIQQLPESSLQEQSD